MRDLKFFLLSLPLFASCNDWQQQEGENRAENKLNGYEGTCYSNTFFVGKGSNREFCTHTICEGDNGLILSETLDCLPRPGSAQGISGSGGGGGGGGTGGASAGAFRKRKTRGFGFGRR